MSHVLALHDSHNASICEMNKGNIIYFQEAERLNKEKQTIDWKILLNKYENKFFDKIIFVRSGYTEDKVPIIILENLLKKLNINYKNLIIENFNHHFFHACCAFFNSGLKKSYVLVADGAGSKKKVNEFYSSEIVSLYYFNKNKFKKIFQLHCCPEDIISKKDVYLNTISLGMYFEFVMRILKLKEPGSIMGFSSYGKEIVNDIPYLFRKKSNHFQSIPHSMLEMIRQAKQNKKFEICVRAQQELEYIILSYVENILKNKKRNICVSGGIFQNTVLNSKILDVCPDLYVDPFADDSGLSMGAALWHSNKNKFNIKKINNLYLGDLPNYNDLPKDKGIVVTPKRVAEYISQGNIVAIYQGKNEMGKRALGNRSFLFDPRDPYAKDKMNLLKNREWFRPTAGTILHEHAHEWFDLKSKKETPFMSYVFKLKKNDVPGITHIDNTCRIQTLKKEENYHYYDLINEFYKITKVPILLNTSFNLAGEPLVNSIYDAIETLINCDNKFNVIYFPEISKIYETHDFL